MRTSLWPGLLKSAQFNLNRQQPAVRFFETGVCFLGEENQIKHVPRIAGIILGAAAGMQWGLSTKAVDFFDLKGDLENLFALTQDPEFSFMPGQHPALHPGRCAKIQRAGKPIGVMGELHPEHQRTLDLPMTAYLFDLDLADLLPAVLPAYTNPSKYPSIQRDLAFIVDDAVSYQAIRTTIQEALATEALQGIEIFDVYRGKNIPAGKKSIALSLTFQLTSRTLTDEEVETAVTTIINRLATSQGAILRAE
jgi:phenylalanyl-tRNA synthetase beta chain